MKDDKGNTITKYSVIRDTTTGEYYYVFDENNICSLDDCYTRYTLKELKDQGYIKVYVKPSFEKKHIDKKL